MRALAEVNASGAEDALFTERFLIEWPLLQAIRSDRPGSLLIDEVDRAGEEFEALLLEVQRLPDHDSGTRVAHRCAPLVVMLTSNATRDLSDALKWRRLHIALDYPAPSSNAKFCARPCPISTNT